MGKLASEGDVKMKCIVCANEGSFEKLSPALCAADNWLCQECGLVFIPRKRGEKHAHYRDGGYYTKSPNLGARRILTSKHLLLRSAEARVKEIDELSQRQVQNQKVLDVGCGYGEILAYMRSRRQCEVLGMEPSSNTARAGEELFGIKIIPSLFEDHGFGDETFDLIICNHTLEHVDEPGQFLRSLKSRLKPTGMLYLEVPNIMWPSGGFTLNAFLYDEHLQTFSSWNLSQLLKQCGLAVLAYSDKDFLRFICGIGQFHRGTDLRFLPASQIEAFLRDYKDNYSLAQHARVFAGKFGYLASLSCSKLFDLMNYR